MLRTRIILCILSAIQAILTSGHKSSSSRASKIYDKVSLMETQAADIIRKGEQAKSVADKLSQII